METKPVQNFEDLYQRNQERISSVLQEKNLSHLEQARSMYQDNYQGEMMAPENTILQYQLDFESKDRVTPGQFLLSNNQEVFEKDYYNVFNNNDILQVDKDFLKNFDDNFTRHETEMS